MFDKIVEAGFDILGGQLSAGANRQTQRAAADLQREFAKNGIQWRVEDAKKAGLHPLAALGSFPTSASPIALEDPTGASFSKAGQSIGAALTRSMTADDRESERLNQELVLSQIRESDARRLAIMSDIGLKAQAAGQAAPGLGIQQEGSVLPIGQVPNIPGSGVIDVKASEIISSAANRSSMVAGIRPGEEQRMIGGMPIILPELGGESSEEIISEMSPLSWAGLLARNSKLYGKGWLEAFLKMRYLGEEPKEHFPTIQEQSKMGRMNLPKSGLDAAIDRAIGEYRTYKKRYNRWSKKHPSGRR